MTRRATALVVAAIVAATILCDQLSKRLAFAELGDGVRHSYLADTVRLEYSENTGAFLGLGAALPAWARTALFSVGTAVILVGCVVASFSRDLGKAGLVGLWLLFAGGVSNLVDRVLYGRVVDFLNVGIGPVRTGIFNIADMAITFGVLIVLLGARSAGHDEERSLPHS
jgi:signal peptidase II